VTHCGTQADAGTAHAARGNDNDVASNTGDLLLDALRSAEPMATVAITEATPITIPAW